MLIYVPQEKEINSLALVELKKAGHKILTGNISKNDKKIVEVIFVRTYVSVDKNYLDDFPNLRYILKATVGIDNIDLNQTKKRNIQIINAPQSNSNAVAELVVCLMLMLLRNTRQQSHRLRNGQWRGKELMGGELRGKTIGFIGCGAIAKSVAYKILAFDIGKIIGFDPYLDEKTLKTYRIKKVELNDLIKNSDIISLHLPLTKETKNLITLKEIKTMKKNAYIINTSRGGIINESDLILALQDKIIAGAALDVFENEPNLNPKLLTLNNIVLTPHIGAYTYTADEEMSMVPVKNFLSSVR